MMRLLLRLLLLHLHLKIDSIAASINPAQAGFFILQAMTFHVLTVVILNSPQLIHVPTNVYV